MVKQRNGMEWIGMYENFVFRVSLVLYIFLLKLCVQSVKICVYACFVFFFVCLFEARKKERKINEN